MARILAALLAAAVVLAPRVASASVTVTVNGTNHTIPQTSEKGWGANVTAWIQAISSNTLQPSGGTFTLSAETDFGSAYGLKSLYFKGRTANPASTGIFRLANSDAIKWRNAGNSGDISLTPGASDGLLDYNGVDLVGTSLTQTLTNKSLDASSNTLTNIGNSAIAASAAIARSKLASGTASHVLINDGSGVMSSEAQLGPSRGGSGVANSGTLTWGTNNLAFTTSGATGVTLPTTGTLLASGAVVNADINASAAIARSKVAAGTASHVVINDGSGNLSSEASLAISRGGTGQASKTAAFDALSPNTTKGDVTIHNGTNNVRQAIGSDGQVLVADSAQTAGVKWAVIQGGVNYATNPGAESNATGCNAYADAAASSPVDGTGGSPTITCTRTTTAPLVGTGSFLITKDAANRQGNGVSFDFTIDREAAAKVIQVSFTTEVKSGTYDAGSDTTDPDITAWVYGPTDGTPTLRQLAPYKVLGTASGIVQQWQGSFQADTAASGVAYRLILHEAKTGTSAYTLALDDLNISPVVRLYGAPITDWQSYTPTGAWVSNTTYTGQWRRVGDTMEVRFKAALSGAPTSATFTLNLPSGYSIDTSKIPNAALREPLGLIHAQDNGVDDYPGEVQYNNTTSVTAVALGHVVSTYDTNGAFVTQAVPFTFGNTDYISGYFRVPITGWSSSVQMSNDADTRVVAGAYYLSANSAAAHIPFDTKIFDTHNAATLGASFVYTAPVPGYYSVSLVALSASGTNNFQLYKNGAMYSGLGSPASTSALGVGSTVIQLNAGDTIYPNNPGGITITGAAPASNGAVFTVHRLTGPSAIAASDSVGAFYSGAPATGTITSSFNAITYGTKVKDTHGAYSAGTWTAPVSGSYSISASVDVSGTYAAANRTLIEIWVNGAAVARGGSFAGSSSTSNIIAAASIQSYPILAGQTVQVKAFSEATSPVLTSVATNNYFSIAKVGN